MERSSIIALVGAGLGVLATFMPWAHAGIFSVSGSQGPDGYLNLAIFGVPLLLSLIGGKISRPPGGVVSALMIVFGLLGMAFGVLKLGTIAGRVSPGIGIFAIVGAGLVVVLHVVGKEKAPPAVSTHDGAAAPEVVQR